MYSGNKHFSIPVNQKIGRKKQMKTKNTHRKQKQKKLITHINQNMKPEKILDEWQIKYFDEKNK